MKFQTHKKSIPFQLLVTISLLINLILGMIQAQAATPASEVQTAITHGIAYLQTSLNVDGGVRWMDDTSSVPTTIRTVLALAAAGFPQDKLISSNGTTPIDYLVEESADWVFQRETELPVLNIARAGQLLTAVAAANQDPYAFGTEALNLVHLINTYYDPNTGVYGEATPDNVTHQVWAMLGLASAYASVPQEAVNWLANAQLDDGSWDDGFGSYLDTTPLAVMALMASGFKSANDTEILLAIDFFQAHQNPEGGWQTVWDSSTNANTTGMILQGLYAANQNPEDTPWVNEDRSPLTALLALQKENGAIGGDFTNAYSTADAILGLSGQPLYDLGHVRKLGRAFEYLFAAQTADGGWGSVGQTLDVIIAAQSAGWDPYSLTRDGHPPLEYITNNLEMYLESGPDAIGKTILGAVAAGENPADFAGADLVSALMETYSTQTGAFGTPDNTWHQAFSILGSTAADTEVPEDAIHTLLNLQLESGGWEYSPGLGAWPDSTALALQALLAVGMASDEEALQNGIDYIQSQQLEDGGWGDASTSAYALMALNSMGIDPVSLQTESGKNPIINLFSFQNPSGAFRFSDDFSDDNVMATATGALAAIGGDFLILPAEKEGGNAAGLVIQTDQGEVTTACIPFAGETISGLDLLDASEISYELQDGFMNSIMNLSNPRGGTMYWSYWQWNGREWVFNNTGARDSRVLPGSIEAWYFTSWEIFPSPPPDFVPHISAICAQNVLKDYAAQPYLNYYDLNPMPESQAQDLTPLISDPVEEADSTEIKEFEDSANPPLSPIIIIGVVGLLVVIAIVWILFRKK